MSGPTLPVQLDLLFCLANFFGLFIVWLHNRGRFDGLLHWLCSVICQATGLGLILALGNDPGDPAGVLPRLFLTGGLLLLVAGLHRFVGLATPWKRLALLLLVQVGAAPLCSLLRIMPPDPRLIRDAVMSLTSLWLAWLLLCGVRGRLRKATRLVGVVACVTLLVSVCEAVLKLFPGAGRHLPFLVSEADTTFHLALVALNTCMTLSLTLMVNQRLLQEILDQQELFIKAFHGAPYAILLIDAENERIVHVNDSVTRLSGYEPGEMVGRTPIELDIFQDTRDRDAILDTLDREGAVDGMELRYRTKAGDIRSGYLHVDQLPLGDRPYLLASLGDITELSRMKARLEVLATHDALTGLPNRSLFRDRFEHALAAARRNGRMLAVLSLDLDHFKRINDEMGHQAGDAVLVETAKRLSSVVRASDTAARFGGDEFVLLLEDLVDSRDAQAIAVKIQDAMLQPFLLDSRAVRVRASLGMAFYPADGDTLQALLRRSDMALYRDKKRRPDPV